jgi:hypothetical protein
MVVATDLASGANTILSRADGATGALGNQGSTDIAVNSDGSQVAFESTATNLTTDTPTGGATHTFIRGLYPIPTATPLPTPHVGATSPTSGWPGTGLLAILAGAITIATVAVTTRRRAGPTP